MPSRDPVQSDIESAIVEHLSTTEWVLSQHELRTTGMPDDFVVWLRAESIGEQLHIWISDCNTEMKVGRHDVDVERPAFESADEYKVAVLNQLGELLGRFRRRKGPA